MVDQPEASGQQADAVKGYGDPRPIIVLKTELDTNGAQEAAHKIKDAPEIQLPAPAPRWLSRIWHWLRKKSQEATVADWAMVFFTFILAASTIVFTVYARRQWQEMKSGGTDTRNLAIATGELAKAAKISADAAKSAAETAKASLESAARSFRTEERAYVATTAFIMGNPAICELPAPNQGTRVCVDIHMVNSGKTPAVGILTSRHIAFGSNARETVENFKVPIYPPSLGEMWGTGVQYATAYSDIVDMKTAQDLVGAKTLGSLIYAYGVVQYRDIFGAYHETGYCSHRVLNSTAFMGCQFGNWFDKRPQQKQKSPNTKAK